MSTGTATDTTATDATVVAPAVQYDDKNAPGYKAPPAGMRYVRANGKVLIGQDGNPVAVKSKKSGKRNKGKKPVYTVPATKLPSAETLGFNVESHAKLKLADFVDPLDYSKWEVWYYEQRVAIAKKDVERLASLGTTVDERKDAMEDARLMKALTNLMSKRGGAQKKKLSEMLGNLYAESEAS